MASNQEKIEWIKWDDKYKIGYKRIDDQHKELVNIINDLYNVGIVNDLSNEEVKVNFHSIIKRTIDYATYHFSYEEKIMGAVDYSLAKDHIAKHRSFSLKIVDDVSRYENGDDLAIEDFLDFLKNWLLHHIIVEDKKFISELKSTLQKMYEDELN